MKKKKWLPVLVVWLILGGVAVWGLSQFVTEQIWKSHNYIVEGATCHSLSSRFTYYSIYYYSILGWQ